MKYLKKLFTLLVIALFSCGFAACSSDDDELEEPALEVTPANLHGTWKLVEWNNGEQVPEGTYCYIVFNRKEQTFEMYQKFACCIYSFVFLSDCSRRFVRFSLYYDGDFCYFCFLSLQTF